MDEEDPGNVAHALTVAHLWVGHRVSMQDIVELLLAILEGLREVGVAGEGATYTHDSGVQGGWEESVSIL